MGITDLYRRSDIRSYNDILKDLEILTREKKILGKLKNQILYQKICQYQDKLKFKIIKIKRLSKPKLNNMLPELFSLVDRASMKKASRNQ